MANKTLPIKSDVLQKIRSLAGRYKSAEDLIKSAEYAESVKKGGKFGTNQRERSNMDTIIHGIFAGLKDDQILKNIEDSETIILNKTYEADVTIDIPDDFIILNKKSSESASNPDGTVVIIPKDTRSIYDKLVESFKYDVNEIDRYTKQNPDNVLSLINSTLDGDVKKIKNTLIRVSDDTHTMDINHSIIKGLLSKDKTTVLSWLASTLLDVSNKTTSRIDLLLKKTATKQNNPSVEERQTLPPPSNEQTDKKTNTTTKTGPLSQRECLQELLDIFVNNFKVSNF